jgi:hypothetical protein
MVIESPLYRRPNAAPEWQAEILGWRSKELVAACPLEGLVRKDVRNVVKNARIETIAIPR